MEAALGAGQELFKMIFEWFEGSWQEGHETFRHKGQEDGVFRTTVGDVEFNRLLVIRNRKNLFPLGEWVGIESKDRCSTGLREKIVEEGVTQSFRKSAHNAKKKEYSFVS